MFDNWREVLHIGEWSGLMIGAAAGLGALAWYVAPLRKLAIVGAVAAGCFYAGELHGDSVGGADKQKEWDAARLEAVKEQTARDSRVALELDAKYQPKLAELQKQSDARKKQVDDYESRILSMWTAGAAKPSATAAKPGAAPAAARCELGAATLKLRGK